MGNIRSIVKEEIKEAINTELLPYMQEYMKLQNENFKQYIQKEIANFQEMVNAETMKKQQTVYTF